MKNTFSEAINVLRPGATWAVIGADNYDNLDWRDSLQSKPTKAEVDAQMAILEEQYLLQDCKEKASALLYETDWTTIPDVADPANSPYLTNQAEFIAWRSQVRGLAVNPVVNPTFPTKPNEVWG